jgi:predicted PurR-regulated permease PerM
MSGAIIIIGVVPFLMFFLLIQKVHLKQKLAIEWGETIDVCSFATSVTSMVRGFAIGNLLIAAAMALVTIVVLFAMETDGAVLIGTVSGFLNLIPFVGNFGSPATDRCGAV